MWPNPQFPADLVTYTEEIHNGKLHFSCSFILYPASIYLFKVNNENTRAVCKICPKLTIKTPERSHWRRSGAFFLTLYEFYILFWSFTHSGISTVNFEQKNAGWVQILRTNLIWKGCVNLAQNSVTSVGLLVNQVTLTKSIV